MAELRVIETEYEGYRFRSRLEARWAVCFDALRVRWQYETEGFELAAAGRYLPDFWLPDWQMWLEIKAGDPSDEERGRCAALARATGDRALLLAGEPWWEKHRLHIFEPDGFSDIDGAVLVDCRKCSGLCYFQDNDWQWAWGDIGLHTCGEHENPPVPWPQYSPRLVAAFTAARSARFEYGEHGWRP